MIGPHALDRELMRYNDNINRNIIAYNLFFKKEEENKTATNRKQVFSKCMGQPEPLYLLMGH